MELEMKTAPVDVAELDGPAAPLKNRTLRIIGRSRFAGLLLVLPYGALMYLFVTALLLSGPPISHTSQDKDFEALLTEGQTQIIGILAMALHVLYIIVVI